MALHSDHKPTFADRVAALDPVPLLKLEEALDLLLCNAKPCYEESCKRPRDSNNSRDGDIIKFYEDIYSFKKQLILLRGLVDKALIPDDYHSRVLYRALKYVDEGKGIDIPTLWKTLTQETSRLKEILGMMDMRMPRYNHKYLFGSDVPSVLSIK